MDWTMSQSVVLIPDDHAHLTFLFYRSYKITKRARFLMIGWAKLIIIVNYDHRTPPVPFFFLICQIRQ